MSYSLIISLLAYFGAVQMCAKFKTGPIFNSLLAVIFPFAVVLCLNIISVVSYNLPVIENLFSITALAIVVLQFIISFIVFRKLLEEDSYSSWFGWSIGGMITIIIIAPFVVNSLPSIFTL